MAMRLDELAERIGGRLVGDGAVRIEGCAPIAEAGPHELAFVANRKYARFLPTTRAGAVLVDERTPLPEGRTGVICADPYYAFRNALVALVGFRRHPEPMDGAARDDGAIVSPHASVHPSATIHAGARIHPHATVEAGATVGPRSVLYPGAFVGPDARIGADCLLFPNAVVYDGCVLGDRVTLHACCVVGHDGFGYATHAGAHHKIPQTGRVVIEDDVELGAGCAIERAAIGDTRIGAGTKFADLISIGHGTTIGKHCLLVSLVGISGSVEVGDYVVLGGQVGVTGHLRIGDGVQAAGRTAIASDVAPWSKVGGVPAVDHDTAKRNALAGRELYALVKRVQELEKKVARELGPEA